MKKILPLNLILLAALLLSACSGANLTTAAASSGSYTSAALKTDYSGALPAASQLAVGVIKLDEQGSGVGKDGAATLLPLWKTLRALNSDTAASTDEINAVVRQIEKSLTDEQLKAIAAMKLTAKDQATVLANVKVSPAAAAPKASGTQSSGNSGGGPGGGPGGGMGGPPGGGDMGGMGMGGGPQAQTTTAASGAAKTSSDSGIDAELVSAVISFLQSK